jgi:signal transduction histidine kinase
MKNSIKCEQGVKFFIRGIVHELKTPVMLIKGYLDLFLCKFKENLSSEELQIMNQIKEGSLRLETLIHDILHESEMNSCDAELKMVQNNLSALIELSVRELKSLAVLKGHRLLLNIPNIITINFDKDQIRKVINNFITNAIKYTPLNGVIEITAIANDDFVIVAVKDNGIGVTDKDNERLFSHFGKIEPDEQGNNIITESSGVGLYLCKKIIELHSGEIWVESEGKNKGSIFFFSLPKVSS